MFLRRRAQAQAVTAVAAPTGRTSKAQGNALGQRIPTHLLRKP
jgi:hypothetical protein